MSSCGFVYMCAQRQQVTKRSAEDEGEIFTKKQKLSQLGNIEREQRDLLNLYKECTGREYAVGDFLSLDAYAYTTGKLTEFEVLRTYFHKQELDKLHEMEQEREREREQQDVDFRRSREEVVKRLALLVKDPIKLEQIQMNSITRQVAVLSI
jgi:hypothetical protein